MALDSRRQQRMHLLGVWLAIAALGAAPQGGPRLLAEGAAGAGLESAPRQAGTGTARWYPAPRERSYALLVGVGRYQDTGISSLAWSVPDAKALYGVLTDPAVGAYPPDNVVLLTDDAPADRQPTRNILLGYLKVWLGQVGKNADSILLYFSGHGIEEDGRGYLVPSDAQAGLLVDTAVDLARVNQLLDATGAKVKIVIVDACHSAAGKDLQVEMAPTLAQQLFTEADGRVTLASCKEKQRSWEWPQKGHGVFTQYLLEALQGAGDQDRDGSVTLNETYAYVFRGVKEWAARNRKEQEPRLKADVSGEVVLTGMTPGKPAIHRPDLPANTATGWQAPVLPPETLWTTLFDGVSFRGWVREPFQPGQRANTEAWSIQGREIVGMGLGHLRTEAQFGDFVLSLQFKASAGANGGVLVHWSGPPDVRTGFEVQILGERQEPNFDSTGAIYRLLEPTKDLVRAPDEWNDMMITCKGSHVTVAVNGEVVNDMDRDLWTEAGKNPDGKPNYRPAACRDLPRRGYIALQTAGGPRGVGRVWYRGLKIHALE